MEASKTDSKNKLNVIRVVNLKRFKPEAQTKQNFKRINHICSSRLNHNTPMKIHNSTKEIQNKAIVDFAEELSINQSEETLIKQNETPNSLELNKLTNMSGSKIIFRNCSHTQEDLSKLIEHSAESLVKVGDVFDSRESFRQYINDKAKTWFYYYVCRNSKKKILEYNCICMAYSAKPRDVIIRRQKTRTTACPCKIRLSVDQSTKSVSVYYVCNHHDHDLTEAAFCHYPHAKYLPQQVKDEFLDLAYLGLDVDLIQKYIHSLIGLTIKRKDIWSYAYKFKRKIFQRSLTADRRKYLNDLILKIRDTFDETFDIMTNENSVEDCVISTVNKLSKPEQAKRRKSQINAKKRQTALKHSTSTAIDGVDRSNNDMNNDLNSNNINVENADIIVQYINEKGILCDEYGTPITTSTDIMQFINYDEYLVPEASVKKEFLDEGKGLSELVENINEEIYPLDWDSIQEINPVIEKTSVDNNESYVVNEADNLVLMNDGIAEELSVITTEYQQSSEQDKTITVLRNVGENFDERHLSLSPTIETPALYAEMENFLKYYFVDHRYIKYEGDDSKCLKDADAKNKHPTGQGHTVAIDMICEEYIKAPDIIYCHTPLKQCSGHENLTLLTDPDAILPGAKFLMLDVFLTYVNERAARWFFYYSLMESGKSPEYYVYKCLFGKNRTSKNAYRARGLRKRPKLATQCPCQIRLRRLDSDPAYLTVLYSCNHHDHPLEALLFRQQPHSRRLPDHIKEEVKDLLYLGVTFDVLRKYVTSVTGLEIYGKYFHNVKVKMRKNNEDRQFSAEKLMVLNKKIKDLEAMYGNTSKGNSQSQTKKRKLSTSQIQMEDGFIQSGMEETATQSQEYIEFERIDDTAEEICSVQYDSLATHATCKRSRLETRLQNISSHSDTLMNVRRLQESVRCDEVRNCSEVVYTTIYDE